MTAAKRVWTWLIGHPARALVPAVPGLIATIGAYVYGSTGEKTPLGGTELEPWATAVAFLGISLIALSLAALLKWDERRRYAAGNRREQIERLSKALEEGLRAADAIKSEIEAGDRVLAEIERRLESSRELAQLSDGQAAAVREYLGSEFSRFRRGSIWRDAVFTLIGAGLGFYLPRLLG